MQHTYTMMQLQRTLLQQQKRTKTTNRLDGHSKATTTSSSSSSTSPSFCHYHVSNLTNTSSSSKKNLKKKIHMNGTKYDNTFNNIPSRTLGTTISTTRFDFQLPSGNTGPLQQQQQKQQQQRRYLHSLYIPPKKCNTGFLNDIVGHCDSNHHGNSNQRLWYGSFTEPSYLSNNNNGNNSSSSMKDSESFKVAHINYDTGKLRQIYLPPTEILKRMSILPRDLVSLQLTTRQERYEFKRDFYNYQKQQQQQNNSASSSSKGNGRGGGGGGMISSSRLHNFNRPPTAILPRTDCILLSFGNIRAVAGRDSVYILDAHTQIAKSFAKEVSKCFQMSTEEQMDPPELILVEVVLRDTVETYMRRIRVFEPIVNAFLDRVVGEVFSDQGVHQLAPLKDALQSFELQVKQSVDCLTQLLNDDEEMLKLLLTEQKIARMTGTPVDFERHQHVELFLGVYARQLNNILQEIHYLLGRLQSKQEFIALALAGYRNRLVRMNVNIGIIGMTTGITTAVTGLFGMNLVSGLEEMIGAFYVVTALSTSTAIVVGFSYFQFMSGRVMQQRAAERLVEIETLTNALSDMSALDYTVKKMVEGELRIDKTEFKNRLISARLSQHASDEEIDLLFNALDCHKDNHLSPQDFPTLTNKHKNNNAGRTKFF